MNRDKIRYYVTEHKLAVVLGAVFLISAILLFARKPIEYNLLDNSEEIDKETSVYNNISLENSVLSYNAEWSEESSIDFTYAQNAVINRIGTIPYGMYYMHVDYDTLYDTTTDNYPICSLDFTGLNKDKFQMEQCFLYDYKKWVEVPLWINSIQGSEDMQLNIGFHGYGDVQIKGLYLVESKLWKIGFLLTEGIVFLLILYMYYSLKKSFPEARIKLLAVVFFVVFASLPVFLGSSMAYYVELHDYWFHANRIASIANEIRYGNFPALYQSDAMNGYGYVSLVMYGDIFLYPAAIMHLLGYTIPACYNFYIFMTNLMCIFIAWYSFKTLFKEDRYALLGTVLYVLAAYRLGNIYIRAAVGEYTAMVFLPLVIAGLYNIYFETERPRYRDAIPLMIGISGIIESHVLTMEMLAWFLVIFAIIFFKKTIKRLLILIESVFSVLLLNAFFIVPFLDTMKQGLLVSASNISENLQSSGVSLAQILSVFVTYSGTNIDYGTKSEMPLSLGISLVIGTVLFVVVWCYKSTWDMTEDETESFNLVKIVFCFALASIFLASKYFPWMDLAYKENKIVILITSLQFVWRYLSLSTILLTIVTVYAVKMLDKKGIRSLSIKKLGTKLSCALMIITFFIAGYFFTGFIDRADAMKNISATSNVSVDDLYLPLGMDKSKTYETSVFLESENAASVSLADTDKNNNKIFNVDYVIQDCVASFPVIYYDYLVVYDKATGEMFNTSKGYNQRLSVVLNKGYTGHLVVTYRIRKLWKISYLVSSVTIVVLGIYCIRNNFKRRRS